MGGFGSDLCGLSSPTRLLKQSHLEQVLFPMLKAEL